MSFETAHRQPPRHALVLGATGAYGAHVTAALIAKGWTITALNRDPEAARRKAGVNMPIDWVTGDAMVAADVEAAARGARLIVHAVNPPRYRNWAGTVMPMLEATIVAAKSHGARILLPGTVYNYAPDSGPLIAEDAVQAPVTRKGAIRARMEARLREASAQGVTSLIMRAGDFFGPATENSALTWMVIKQRGRARAVLSPGPADVGHAFAYLPDLARATAMVLEREVELAQFETFHFGGHWLTPISLRDAVRAAEDRPRLPSLPFPAMILRAMAPFDETMREMLEMQYLWHRPIGLDNRKLAVFLGAEPRTPLETAIRATLADVADGQAEPCVRRSDSRGIGFCAGDLGAINEGMPKTLYEKIWDSHVVSEDPNGETVLYIDLHLVHEVTTPQAFAGLRAAHRGVRRPDRTLAVADHNVPTEGQALGLAGVADPEARLQLETLERNMAGAGIEIFKMGDPRNGIVHVVGPEQGRTQPGMTIVCGDSHTSTHGAFGALAHGIGTSEVEHVLATQTLRQRKSKTMRVRFDGVASAGVGPKDFALALIGKIGTDGGTGYVIEYAGEAIEALSMEGRMTLCNMTIEAGARAGLIAPDEITFAYLAGRPAAPKGGAWEMALGWWKSFASDPGARFDTEIKIDVAALTPMVTWGTSPQDVVAIDGRVPDPADFEGPRAEQIERALIYMGLEPGQRIDAARVDRVFIGSCTNSRIEDLRAAADIARGRHVADHVRAMVVPGSGLVKDQAESEGLDVIFREAGFDWREPGCSMCLGMNPDRLAPGERCASTSNRNFEGRQGRGGRTHLMSPAMAAAAAIVGRLVDARMFARS